MAIAKSVATRLHVSRIRASLVGGCINVDVIPLTKFDPHGHSIAGGDIGRILIERVSKFTNPYARSSSVRFVVTNDELGAGEIIRLSRRTTKSRFWPAEARRRNASVISNFERFASAQNDRSDFRFWNFALPNGKARLGELKTELDRFNRLIGQHFNELHKKKIFELLLLAIHIRWDNHMKMYDLHVHFVCRVTDKNLDKVQAYLIQKFFTTAGGHDQEPVRNPGRCATYVLNGILDHGQLVSWPEEPFREVWALCSSKRHLMRTGGAFALWQGQERAIAEARNSATAYLRAWRSARAAARREDPGYDPYAPRKVADRVSVPSGGTIRRGALFVEDLPAPAEEDGAAGGPDEDFDLARCVD